MDNRYVCFTGHRPKYFTFKDNENDPACLKLKSILKNEIIKTLKKGYRKFISGMAIGWDQWAVEILLELKKDFPDIYIEGTIPCLDQDKMWSGEQKNRYKNLLRKLDLVHNTGLVSYEKNPNQMTNRDICMANKASIVIAGFNGSPSGTKKTYDYAISKKKNIILINPNTFKVSYVKGEDTKKTLECSNHGDANFSATYAVVTMFDKTAAIESFYQRAKRCNGVVPTSTKEAKAMKPTHLSINNIDVDIKYAQAWYKLLWCKYLDTHPKLVSYASEYEVFSDITIDKSKNPQSKIIETYIRGGRDKLLEETKELVGLLKNTKASQPTTKNEDTKDNTEEYMINFMFEDLKSGKKFSIKGIRCSEEEFEEFMYDDTFEGIEQKYGMLDVCPCEPHTFGFTSAEINEEMIPKFMSEFKKIFTAKKWI